MRIGVTIKTFHRLIAERTATFCSLSDNSGQRWILACGGLSAFDPEQTWGTMAYCRGKSIIAKTIRKSGPSFAWGEFW
jgi:hypothetical protein